MKATRRTIYVFLFFLSTINYIDRVALSVSAPSIVKDFGLTPVELGYLFSSFLWLYVVCLIPMGMLVDAAGARRVNAAGMALWSAATVLTGRAGSFATLIAARVAMGIGESTTYPAAGRVLREWAPARERAFATNVFNSGAYFGPALGALLLAPLVAREGWRSAFYLSGAFGFVWLAFWLIWYQTPDRVRWLGEEERSMIRREREASGAAPASDMPAPESRMSIARLLASRSMLGLMLTQGAAVYTQYLFLTWLPSYLETAKGITALKSGEMMAVPYFGAVVLTILLGRLSDHLLIAEAAAKGLRRRMVAIAMAISSVILLTPLIDSVTVILALILIALTGVSTAVGLNIALVSDLLRAPANIGRATGLLIFGGNIFGILAPIVTGYVIAASGGYGLAFVVAGVLLAFGATSILLLARHPIG